ncbi:glycosyltransferase family 2 protein [Schaalia sp. lx-260]|uniref:glycosyltransferase family 2 protein n=1 Tax=Schaalia sp. lx-260 TaxID=2899082 RepID=UPI001E2AA430|nr:glycosyltransferase [Schaalia sp. lx-260]MCD4549519.1 glycosyltransferase [Schaalia sp. lx-260]
MQKNAQISEYDDRPLLSVIVPSYNSQDYLGRAMQSLVGYGDEVEVLIVNDGSTDETARIADQWAAQHPGRVRAIHQKNAGHGGALNAGIAHARGTHLKVVDSDDWVDRAAMQEVLRTLRTDRENGQILDLLVTNYVYEKQGRAHKAVIKFRNVLPQGRVITWDDMRPCRYDQYLMMHSLILRTDLVRESGLILPEHTFYVDYLYSHTPLPLVRTIRYLDVDLYRYFIGRDDQSVNESVMITRIDQLLRVNLAMVEAMPNPADVPANLYRYMVHYLRINCAACTVMLLLSGTPEHLETKERLWRELAERNPQASRAVRADLLGCLITLPGRAGQRVITAGYKVARSFIGFN